MESRFRLWETAKKEKTSETAASAPTPVRSETNSWGDNIFINYWNANRGEPGTPYTIKEISAMAKDPTKHIKILRQWARWAYYSNGTVSAAIDSLKSIYPLDYIVVAEPKDGEASGRRAEYRHRMDNLLRSVRYKEVIRDAIAGAANEGTYFGYFEAARGSGNSPSFYPLPAEYCRIIGRGGDGGCYEIAFDLRYFVDMTPGERKRTLAAMPRVIRTAWTRYGDTVSSEGKHWIKLDWRKTVVAKIKSRRGDPCGVPFAVAALDDIEYAKYFTNTKRNVLGQVNNQIYYETFPEGRDKGTSALSEAQQKQQHDTVKQALTEKGGQNGVSFFSLAAGTHMDSLPVDISLLDEENENAISDDVNEDLGFSAAALSGKSSGNYATATLNMEIIAGNVFTWIEDIATEMNKCFRYGIFADEPYEVEFRILPVNFLNRDKQVKYMGDLYARGKGSLLAWIATAGMKSADYLSLMEAELEEDYENRFPVHKTSFTVTGKDAPEYQDVDGSGSNESTRNNNGNASPSPSD